MDPTVKHHADDDFAPAYADAGQFLEEFGKLLHLALRRDNTHPVLMELSAKLEVTYIKWKGQTFKVAVLALVKSGKSTLINATLGDEFLPAANTPETTRIVRTIHSPDVPDGELQVGSVVHARGAVEIKTLLRSLNQQLRQDDTLQTTDDIVLAAPLQALATSSFGSHRFELLDTPGPNEAGPTTLKARVETLLGEVDVIIYVLDYTKLKTDEEKDLLQTLADLRPELLRQCADRLFFVVNKIDAENRNGLSRGETATYVSQLLRRQFPALAIKPGRILPISAEQALLARLIEKEQPPPKAVEDFIKIVFGLVRPNVPLAECRQHAQDLLTLSHLPELEREVLHYIFEHRGRLLLQGILGDLERHLATLDNHLQTAEGALRERHQELILKAEKLRKDLAGTLAGLRELEAKTEQFKKETEAWIRTKFDRFQRDTYDAIRMTLDPAADSGFVTRTFSRLLSHARSYLFGDAGVEQIRSRIEEVNKCIAQHIRREFEEFRLTLETEAIEKQRTLFLALQDTIQPLVRRIDGYINRTLNITLVPVPVRLPDPSPDHLQQKIQSSMATLIAQTQKTVPVVKQQRYVKRRGLCFDDYGTREVVGYDTITTYAVAVGVLQKFWAGHLKETTEVSITATRWIIKKEIGDAIERMRQAVKAYAEGFLYTIEFEIKESDAGRSSREYRLAEVTAQRQSVAALGARIRGALQTRALTMHSPELLVDNAGKPDSPDTAIDAITALFVAANPRSTGLLDLDEELRDVQTKTTSAKHRDAFNLRYVPAARPDDLEQALLQHKPTIVHFGGHGTPTGLILHGDTDERASIGADALEHLFSLVPSVRLVILNACDSEEHAIAIARTVDFVIGMKSTISDRAARKFVGSLYRGLVFGEAMRTAFELGLNALKRENLEGEEEIPALFIRPGASAEQALIKNRDRS
jgi:GTPase SAR1 family protein